MLLKAVCSVVLVPFTFLYAGQVHERVNKLLNTPGWKCSVKNTDVIDSKEHQSNLCLFNTHCSNDYDGTQTEIVVGCVSENSSSECPTLRECVRNGVEKKDSTVSTFGKIEDFVQSIQTPEGSCTFVSDTGTPHIYWTEGQVDNSSSKKVWDTGTCVLGVRCQDNGVQSSRYAVFCKPKMGSDGKPVVGNIEINGRAEKAAVCPNLRACYDNRIEPRSPKTKYTNRSNGSAATSSPHNGNR